MCNACAQTVSNAEATDGFADQILNMLNQGALALMVSIGHRTGRFDAMAELPPADADAIASQAGLAPRYVKDWLSAISEQLLRDAQGMGVFLKDRARRGPPDPCPQGIRRGRDAASQSDAGAVAC